MDHQSQPNTKEMVIILHALSEPSSLETALTMYGDSLKQFIKRKEIDPFISYRVTRAEADKINLMEAEEDIVDNTQAPSAGDMAEAESEIEDADQSEGVTYDSEDESTQSTEENWSREADPDANEEQDIEEDEAALHVPRRFGKIWSEYVNALELFWSRAEYLICQPGEEVYPEQLLHCETAYNLLRNSAPTGNIRSSNHKLLLSNLELVDKFIQVIHARTLSAIRNIK